MANSTTPATKPAEKRAKTPEQVLLEKRKADLDTIIKALPEESPLRARKMKALEVITRELAALEAR